MIHTNIFSLNYYLQTLYVLYMEARAQLGHYEVTAINQLLYYSHYHLYYCYCLCTTHITTSTPTITTTYLRYIHTYYTHLPSPLRLYLSPIYITGAVSTIHRLHRRQGPLWVLIFLIALSLTLVPTPLLEPRYFSPGVVLALLHSPAVSVTVYFVVFVVFLLCCYLLFYIISTTIIHYYTILLLILYILHCMIQLHTTTTAGIFSCVLTICAMLLVNTITMYIFLKHTYIWNDGSIARFMY